MGDRGTLEKGGDFNTRMAQLAVEPEDEPIYRQGWLVKEGGRIKSWKRRMCVLKGEFLVYYENEQCTKEKGRISLISCTVNIVEERKDDTMWDEALKNQPCMELVTADRRYYFKARADEDTAAWTTALRNKVICLSYLRKCEAVKQNPDWRIVRFCADLENPALFLEDVALSLESLSAVASLLTDNPNISQLRLKGAQLGDMEMTLLVPALGCNNALTALHLDNNSIGPDGVRSLCNALVKSPNIRALYLNENNVGDDGLIMLTGVMGTNRSLETLGLSNNMISDIGAERLARVLREMDEAQTTVRMPKLALSGNDITHVGALALADACQQNVSIINVELQWNKISKAKIEDVRSAFLSGTGVMRLELEHNQGTDDGDENAGEDEEDTDDEEDAGEDTRSSVEEEEKMERLKKHIAHVRKTTLIDITPPRMERRRSGMPIPPPSFFKNLADKQAAGSPPERTGHLAGGAPGGGVPRSPQRGSGGGKPAKSSPLVASHRISATSTRAPSDISVDDNAFTSLLHEQAGMAYFKLFLMKEYSEENVFFWEAVEKYKSGMHGEMSQKAHAEHIFFVYIRPGSTFEVNIIAEIKRNIAAEMDKGGAKPITLFDLAQEAVFDLMKRDSYSRFKKSELFKHYTAFTTRLSATSPKKKKMTGLATRHRTETMCAPRGSIGEDGLSYVQRAVVGSSSSVAHLRQSVTDHLDYGTNDAVKKVISKYGQETVIFSDLVDKVNNRGKRQTRVILITDLAWYNIHPKTYECKRRTPLRDIVRVSYALLPDDDFFIVHTAGGYKYLYGAIRKVEVVATLSETYRKLLEIPFPMQELVGDQLQAFMTEDGTTRHDSLLVWRLLAKEE